MPLPAVRSHSFRFFDYMLDGLEVCHGIVFLVTSRNRGKGLGLLATLVRDGCYLILDRPRALLLHFLLFLVFFAL